MGSQKYEMSAWNHHWCSKLDRGLEFPHSQVWNRSQYDSEKDIVIKLICGFSSNVTCLWGHGMICLMHVQYIGNIVNSMILP